jgi:hypothetical protein
VDHGDVGLGAAKADRPELEEELSQFFETGEEATLGWFEDG